MSNPFTINFSAQPELPPGFILMEPINQLPSRAYGERLIRPGDLSFKKISSGTTLVRGATVLQAACFEDYMVTMTLIDHFIAHQEDVPEIFKGKKLLAMGTLLVEEKNPNIGSYFAFMQEDENGVWEKSLGCYFNMFDPKEFFLLKHNA
jgi:hypothetical protein